MEEDEYYYLTMESDDEFILFKSETIGADNQSHMIKAKEKNGRWKVKEWIINKDDAHMEGNYLVGDDPEVKEILDELSDNIEQTDKNHFMVSK
jgi:hypothetical protein